MSQNDAPCSLQLRGGKIEDRMGRSVDKRGGGRRKSKRMERRKTGKTSGRVGWKKKRNEGSQGGRKTGRKKGGREEREEKERGREGRRKEEGRENQPEPPALARNKADLSSALSPCLPGLSPRARTRDRRDRKPRESCREDSEP